MKNYKFVAAFCAVIRKPKLSHEKAQMGRVEILGWNVAPIEAARSSFGSSRAKQKKHFAPFGYKTLFGGGGPNLVEPQALTVSIGRVVVWRKDKVDLTELAKLRWVDKWTIERLASHFGLGTTSIKMNLRLLKK
ncbi:MAG: hypothetical protein R3A80_11130 [Bdellovibrionota bacterium]